MMAFIHNPDSVRAFAADGSQRSPGPSCPGAQRKDPFKTVLACFCCVSGAATCASWSLRIRLFRLGMGMFARRARVHGTPLVCARGVRTAAPGACLRGNQRFAAASGRIDAVSTTRVLSLIHI